MNYIAHLTAVMERISDDDKLNPCHVSLYLALFQFWNMNRFNNPISINRTEVMAVSKIGSKTTYHKCLKELHERKFIEYLPSHNPMKGSLINLYIFGTAVGKSSVQVAKQAVGQEVVPSINTKKNKKKSSFYIPTIEEVKMFFEDPIEAEKFNNYYSANGWKVGGKTPMKNWQAAARNWMLNARKFNAVNSTKEKRNPLSNGAGHLHVEPGKDYTTPL